MMILSVTPIVLLSLILIGPLREGQTQAIKGNANSKTFRQLNCGVSENVFKRYVIATCSYWPNLATLVGLTTTNGPVNFLIVTMTDLGQVNSSMIANFDLVGLYMTKCGIYDISPVAFETLVRVKEISLSGNNLKSISPRLFTRTKMINSIDLSNNNIRFLDKNMFQGLENLNALDISGNSLTNFPENLPRALTSLNLENNLIINQNGNNVKLSNLEHLNLCYNNMTKGLNFVMGIGSKLHTLCLDEEMVRSMHTETGQLAELQELTIKGRQLKNGRLTSGELESIRDCKKLQKFKIERCDLDSLTILTQFPELSALELKEVYVDVGQLSASDFNGVSRLKTLDLTGSSHLAQTILGNQDIIIKFHKLETLTLKDCELKDLSWIPKRDVLPSSSFSFFPSLSIVDISGNNNFDCREQRVKQILCRFDNFKRIEISPKIVNINQHFRLENLNATNCREKMSFISILQLNFSDCQGNSTAQINWGFHLSGSTSTEVPTITKAITQASFQSKANPSHPTSTIYVVLGVVLAILFLVAVVLAFIYYRRRRSNEVQISPDGLTKNGIANPETVQSEV